MPPSIITIETDHDAGAHHFDTIKVGWSATNAASVSVTIDGVGFSASTPLYTNMPNHECAIEVEVVGTDGKPYSDTWTIPLLPTAPVKPVPFPSPLTPADDPIVSVVVTSTRKSGKVTSTIIV